MKRMRRRLREQGEHRPALADGEVHTLLQLADERAHHRRRRREQARVASPSGHGERAPAEAVREARGVPLDVAVLGEGLQRARDLALVVAEQLRETDDPEPASGVVSEHLEDRESTGEGGSAGVHG
jgi:hypothetical protein